MGLVAVPLLLFLSVLLLYITFRSEGGMKYERLSSDKILIDVINQDKEAEEEIQVIRRDGDDREEEEGEEVEVGGGEGGSPLLSAGRKETPLTL